MFSDWKASFLGMDTYAGAMTVVSFLLIPLILLRSYGDLTPISIASLFFIIIIVFFVLVEGQVENDGNSFHIADSAPVSFFSSLEVLGTFAYSASIQMVMFEAYNSTKDQDKDKFLKVRKYIFDSPILRLMCL